jgi:hypothetical protein
VLRAGRRRAIAPERQLRVLAGRIDEKRLHLVAREALTHQLSKRGIRLSLLLETARNDVRHLASATFHLFTGAMHVPKASFRCQIKPFPRRQRAHQTAVGNLSRRVSNVRGK